MVDLPELLRVTAPYAALGGISIALVIWLFQNIIARDIFPQLSRLQAYRILRLVILLSFVLGMAGLGAWVYERNIRPDIGNSGNASAAKESENSIQDSVVTPTTPDINKPPIGKGRDAERPAKKRGSSVGSVKICEFSGGVNKGNLTQDCSH